MKTYVGIPMDVPFPGVDSQGTQCLEVLNELLLLARSQQFLRQALPCTISLSCTLPGLSELLYVTLAAFRPG